MRDYINMKNYVLDFRKVNNIDEAHKILKETFDFPDYYGKNLDALNDCIGEADIKDKVYIVVTNELFSGFDGILQVLEDNSIKVEKIVEQ